ncbi:MAG: hypothetical protein ACO1RT_10180 [Planctomycetaceae bacterium]
MMRRNFVLIDLVSQRDAVRALLRDVDTETRLDWIASWGTLRTVDVPRSFKQAYVFESRTGLTAGFFFDDDGDFVFLGDHFTFR